VTGEPIAVSPPPHERSPIARSALALVALAIGVATPLAIERVVRDVDPAAAVLVAWYGELDLVLGRRTAYMGDTDDFRGQLDPWSQPFATSELDVSGPNAEEPVVLLLPYSRGPTGDIGVASAAAACAADASGWRSVQALLWRWPAGAVIGAWVWLLGLAVLLPRRASHRAEVSIGLVSALPAALFAALLLGTGIAAALGESVAPRTLRPDLAVAGTVALLGVLGAIGARARARARPDGSDLESHVGREGSAGRARPALALAMFGLVVACAVPPEISHAIRSVDPHAAVLVAWVGEVDVLDLDFDVPRLTFAFEGARLAKLDAQTDPWGRTFVAVTYRVDVKERPRQSLPASLDDDKRAPPLGPYIPREVPRPEPVPEPEFEVVVLEGQDLSRELPPVSPANIQAEARAFGPFATFSPIQLAYARGPGTLIGVEDARSRARWPWVHALAWRWPLGALLGAWACALAVALRVPRLGSRVDEAALVLAVSLPAVVVATLLLWIGVAGLVGEHLARPSLRPDLAISVAIVLLAIALAIGARASRSVR